MQDPKIEAYINLLLEWNEKINLISRKTSDLIREIHIEDSMMLSPFLKEDPCDLVVDIGSGGGLPAIVLSILFPEKHFILTDVVGKKIRFLELAVKELSLNAEVRQVENKKILTGKKCIITSRAYARVSKILQWSREHAPNAETYYLLKGKREGVMEELKEAGVESYKLKDNPGRGTIVVIQ